MRVNSNGAVWIVEIDDAVFVAEWIYETAIGSINMQFVF
jgi:hypothetical protein